MAKKLYYKIGEACKELDIQPYVLRYWETEFPALSPSKSKSGQRVYSVEDLELIRRIKELLYEEGYTIAGAKKKLESESPNRPRAVPDVVDDGPDDEETGDVDEEVPEDDEAEADEEPEPDPPAKAEKTAKQQSRTSRSTAAAAARSREVARLREGIDTALAEAREILDLLDSA